MKRPPFLLVIALVVLALLSAAQPTIAKDNWVSVSSKNFYLVGNASEKEVRQVATRLEQFREVFTRLLSGMNFTSPVPTTVIVFKSDGAYKPYKPVVNGKLDNKIAGYFQAGSAVNYITLTTDKLAENPYGVIFHEYVHLLVNNTLGKGAVPTWFNEGIAEYYSTFDIEDDQKVHLGNLIQNHLALLRANQLLPLDQLLAVNSYSLPRNSHETRGIFYAQSWLMVHYLIQGNEGKKLPQLARFVDLIRKNTPTDSAFKQAFQTDYAGMQKELKNYLQQHTFRGQVATFERKLEFEADMKTAPLTEAQAQAYLGDLLYHIHRPEDAKVKLEQALALDNNLDSAHASLGMVLFELKKLPEAKEQLKLAVAGNSTNYLAHYYYAFALSREVMTDGQPVYGIPAEVAATMRTQLGRAIELKPDFPESYHLLAFVNLVTGEQIDESINLIKRALALSPGSEEFHFVLAQLYLRKEEFSEARKIMEPLAEKAAEPQIRAGANSMLKAISSIQEQRDQVRAFNERNRVSNDGPQLIRSEDRSPAPPERVEVDPQSYLREALRKPEAGETQVQGVLVRIDCDAKGMTFVVKVDNKLVKLKSANFDSIVITTFTSEVAGQIGCGARKAEEAVVISYLPSSDTKAKVDGELRSLEFVPKDFRLK